MAETAYTLNITVRNKIATTIDPATVVNGNNDYTVVFDFDSEWDSLSSKTAMFVYGREEQKYKTVTFTGNSCVMPALYNTGYVLIGVFAGDIKTTTAAYVKCIPCIRDNDSTLDAGGGGTIDTGTNDHSQLINRDLADQHTISAITGLEEALDGKQAAGNYLTDKDLDTTLTMEGKAADAAVVGARLDSLSAEKVSLPKAEDGSIIPGTAGWYAVSDGAGGITWVESAPSTGDETTHEIVWNLVNVTSSNNAVSVANGASLVAVLTPADGYALGDVTVTMGGEVVTGAWNADTATVTITNVTGNVMISCAGVEAATAVSVPYIGCSDTNYNNTHNVSTILSGVSTENTNVQYSYWLLETDKAGTLEITWDDTTADGFGLGIVLYDADGAYVGGTNSTFAFVGTTSIAYGTVAGSPLTIEVPSDYGHSYIMIRVRRGSSTAHSSNAEFTQWVVTSLSATFTVGGVSAEASTLSYDDDLAMDYAVATTSIFGEELATNTQTEYGIGSEFAAVINEAKMAWMTEYAGDYRKIPIVVSTDQHDRKNSGIFNLIGKTFNMHDVSRVMNLGDTISEWYDDDATKPLLTNSGLQGWMDSICAIPFSKRLDVYGNHDTWYGNYSDEGNVIGTRYPSSQAHLYQYFRNIYARRTNNNGWFVTYDDQFNVKYVVVSGFEYRNNSVASRIGTKQMTWLIEELSRNDGYDVVIVSHVPLLFDPEIAISPMGLEINEGYYRVSGLDTDAFFSARKSRGSGTITDSDGVEHTYDFTNCENDVLCSLHGHTHEDAYLYLNDTLLSYTFDWFADNTFFMALIDRVNRCLNVWKIEAPNGVPTYQNYQIPFDKPTA